MCSSKELVDVLKNATEAERAKVTRRLAKMMVDLVTANAHEKAEELVRRIFRFSSVEEGDTITMTYSLGVNGNVVRLLLAGIRREQSKRKK